MEKSFVGYGQRQRDIVGGGVSEVAAVLSGGNLDYYLDPYYGCPLPDPDGIFLLQQCFLTESSPDVKGVYLALQLLCGYCDHRLDILHNHLSDVPNEWQEEVPRLFLLSDFCP